MKKISQDPSPLPIRICQCGCDIEFQPKRSDQWHLNSIHYNFAYNHGPRKEKNAEENEIIKKIRKNDRIVEKYFKISTKDELKINQLLLNSDGFDSAFFTSIVDRNNEKYYVLFNYSFKLEKQGTIKYVIIRKN